MVFCARDTRMHDVQSGGTAALKVTPLSYVNRQTEKQTDTQLSCKQARATGHYLLNMPILINVVMTDPSISPNNLPAYQRRERERHHCHICTVNMEL